MTGFSDNQLKRLTRPADAAHVYKRIRDGREFSYIPGWWAIAEANAIFGYAGWDRQTVHLEKLFDRSMQADTACAYSARVRITVRAGGTNITREGTGFGYGIGRMAADAHERAVKAAETDATKRALATFGDRFGLCLYRADHPDRADHPGPVVTPKLTRLALKAPDGGLLDADLSPEGFAGGLRQLIEKADSAETVDQLISQNIQSLTTLKTGFANLTNRTGLQYADILFELAASRKNALGRNIVAGEKIGHSSYGEEKLDPERALKADNLSPIGAEPSQAQPSSPSTHFCGARPSRIGIGSSIDKSLLNYALERRIRNKQHLSHVGAQPCVICADIPCHAHHITFAQPRGLSVKVSDEFTVPLCAAHHNQLHQTRPERAWWKDQGIDPLKLAAKFWEETLRRLTAQTT